MRVYLSGPITGVEGYAENFKKAEEDIEKTLKDPAVINPVNLQTVLPDGTHAEYMMLSFALLDLSDAICMLPGWEQSKGACMEYGYAVAKGLRIIEKP